MSTSIELSNGVKMPLFGLGTWQSNAGEVAKALKIALELGYRHIDTAAAYQNEAEIGAVLKEFISSGKIKREELFITTKLFWAFNRAEDVEPQIKASLEKLGLDYIDLYLIHMPVSFKQDLSDHDTSVKIEEIWKGMEAIYEKKLAKAIGVSNFNADQIRRIQKVAKVPIHNNQIELHLYFNQQKLVDECQKQNITVTAYAPIGSPGRTDIILGKFANRFGASSNPMENEVVVRLSKKYAKTPAQILLRHLIQRNISVIPKSTNEKRLKENFEVFDFNLSPQEINELNNVPQAPRLFALEMMEGHPEDPFKNERKSA
uniref:NADP-dependent oxidoreductase domain-containing protein n=1 Tax=Panagrolaimus davidi TaxID=227884 RepID=A0A914PS59_9BILA